MKFFLLEEYGTEAVAKTVAALQADSSTLETLRYRNGEMHMRVSPPPSGEHCVVVGSTAPPDTRLLELLMAAHTLKKEGAARVTALIPYLGYARHDKALSGESMATVLVGKLLAAAGIDDIVTVDLHSERDRDLLTPSVAALSPAEIFADVIRAEALTDATLVAPDNGAIPRCERVKLAAGMKTDIVHLRKTRIEGGIRRERFVGEVAERVIIVDDMIDTGETLVSACEMLRTAGAKEIVIMVTHGIFTGDAWLRLRDLGVTRLYCTDTHTLPASASQNWITVLSAAPLLTRHFSSLLQ